MPIYTYRCENCGIQFDRRQKFSDDPLTVCPECEGESLRKVYQPVGIVFKGSGFYATDNRSPSGMERTSSDNGESKSESSTEKKDSSAKKESNKKESASKD